MNDYNQDKKGIEMVDLKAYDLAIIKVRGEITFSYLVAKTMEATEAGNFRLRNFQISDIRNATFMLTQREIYEYIKLLKSDQKYTRAIKTAYIANDNKSTAIAYILTQSFNESISDSVFSTVEAALTRLGLMQIKEIVHCYIEEDEL